MGPKWAHFGRRPPYAPTLIATAMLGPAHHSPNSPRLSTPILHSSPHLQLQTSNNSNTPSASHLTSHTNYYTPQLSTLLSQYSQSTGPGDFRHFPLEEEKTGKSPTARNGPSGILNKWIRQDPLKETEGFRRKPQVSSRKPKVSY